MKTKGSRKSYRLRSRAETAEIHNNWEISYGDMITLLLGFFVIFFNIQNDPLNIQILLDQFKTHLKIDKTESFSFQTQDTILQVFHPDNKDVQTFPYQAGNKLIIEFPDVTFFEAGGIDLTSEGKRALELFAKKAKDFTGDFRFVVRGYTDNKSPGKHPLYRDNLELSAFRSISAIRHLKTHGIQLSDMRIGGYGETDHSERLLPESIRKKDRKIVIAIEPLDRTERASSSFAENFAEQMKQSPCEIDLSQPQKMNCKNRFSLLSEDLSWVEPKAPARRPAQLDSKQNVQKTDRIHNNFLYKYLNDYYYLRENGENP